MNAPRIAEPSQAKSQSQSHSHSHSQSQLQTGETGSGRGKTVTSACERCRRRKIRCDGDTPCSTCRRFRISCVRIQKHDTHALEQRVRELEARIAEFSAGRSNSQSLDTTPIPSPQPQSQPWTPDMRLNTDFGSPGPAVSMETFSPYSSSPDIRLLPLDIPSIQVVDYTDNLSPISPASPISLAPSPMLRALAPAPSTPIPESVDGLRPPGTAAISPPITACPSPNHTFMPYLSPRSMPGPSRSRSSSISSLGLDTDWASAPGDLSVVGLSDTELDPSIFDMFPSPEIEVPWTPTRFEAETLLDKFFDRLQGAQYPLARYPLDRKRLFDFLDIVDHPMSPVGERVCTVPMARFHVYMAMAVGLRMETEARSTTMYILRNCYRLAMDEARDPFFWNQAFALEAAVLIMLFGQVSGQS